MAAKETIDDLLASLKDRFTNPLAFAFLCAWLIWNWRVILALLWTDSLEAEINLSGGLTGYIAEQFSWWGSFGGPLLAAILFVLVLPVAKMLLQMFLAWVNRLGTDRVLRIKQDGSIPVRSYLRLRREYRERTEQLMAIVKEDSGSLAERTRLNGELINATKEKNETQKNYLELEQTWRSMRNIRVLDGWWRNDYVNKASGEKGSEIVFIEQGIYSIGDVASRTQRSVTHMFNILGFMYDPMLNKVTFVKELIEPQKRDRPEAHHYSFNDLEFDLEMKQLSGTENRTTTITYTRIANP